jgi:acetylserotonin N-methyltransferase
MAVDISKPDPSVVVNLLEAFRHSKIMFTAVSLGVFDALEGHPWPSEYLAKTLATNADATERLLDACVGLGLLIRDERGYRNTPEASAYLCKSSPTQITGYVIYSNDVLWKLWNNLEGAIREGTHRWKETFGWDGPIFSSFFRTEAAKREFMMGMHAFGLMSSPQVVGAFDLSNYRTLVDLGGGTGHLAESACQRYPGLCAVVFDLPEVEPLCTELLASSPIRQRIKFVAGSFFSDPLPAGDLFAVGRILHDWGEEKIQQLLAGIFERLPNSGALLIAEKLLFEDKSGPMGALSQSLSMLTCTEGKERTLGEYEAILNKIGFVDVRGCRLNSPLDALLAVKP